MGVNWFDALKTRQRATRLPFLTHFYFPSIPNPSAFKSLNSVHPNLTSLSVMSSPASRRSQRTSATPRRSTRSSLAPQSSPAAQSPGQQLLSEASQPQSDDGPSRLTPQPGNIPTSSPLFFRSSPAGPAANGLNGSSPMPNGNEETTPRASRATIAGMYESFAFCNTITDLYFIQILHQSDTHPALAQQDNRMVIAQRLPEALAVRFLSTLLSMATLIPALKIVEVILPQSSGTQALLTDAECWWMKMACQWVRTQLRSQTLIQTLLTQKLSVVVIIWSYGAPISHFKIPHMLLKTFYETLGRSIV